MTRVKDVFYSYKNFFTIIKWSENDKCFYGKIENITDLCNYEGETREHAMKEFEISVDDYIKICLGLNKKIERIMKFENFKEILYYGLVIFGEMLTNIDSYKEGHKIEIIDKDEASLIIGKKDLSQEEIDEFKDMTGTVCTFYLDEDNYITHIETGIGGLFTLANRNMGIFLYELIGTKVLLKKEG